MIRITSRNVKITFAIFLLLLTTSATSFKTIKEIYRISILKDKYQNLRYVEIINTVDSWYKTPVFKKSFIYFIPEQILSLYRKSINIEAEKHYRNHNTLYAKHLLDKLEGDTISHSTKEKIDLQLIEELCQDLEFKRAIDLAEELENSKLVESLSNRYADYLTNMGQFEKAINAYKDSSKVIEIRKLLFFQGMWKSVDGNILLAISDWNCFILHLNSNSPMKRQMIIRKDNTVHVGNDPLHLEARRLKIGNVSFFKQETSEEILIPHIGMSRHNVLLSRWREPIHCYKEDVFEYWIYDSGHLITFKDDKIVKINRGDNNTQINF